MKNQALANRYAKTLLEVSQKENNSSSVYEQSLTLLDLLDKNQNFEEYLKSPINKIAEKTALVNKVFKDFDSLLLKFLVLLCKKNRINILSDILIRFESLYNESKGIKKAIVSSVTTLTEADIAKIKKALDTKYNADFTVATQTDQELIGGFTIRVDDTIIDHSMKNKLELIEKNLLSVG